MGSYTGVLREVLDLINFLIKKFDNKKFFTTTSLYQKVGVLKMKRGIYERYKKEDDKTRKNLGVIDEDGILNPNLSIDEYAEDYFDFLKCYCLNIRILKDNVKEEYPLVNWFLDALYVELTAFISIYRENGKLYYYTNERFEQIEKEMNLLEGLNTLLTLLKRVNMWILGDLILYNVLRDLHIDTGLKTYSREISARLMTLLQDASSRLTQMDKRFAHNDLEAQEKLSFLKKTCLTVKAVSQFSFEELCMDPMECLFTISTLEGHYNYYFNQRNKFASYLAAALDCINRCVNEPYWDEAARGNLLGPPDGIGRVRGFLKDEAFIQGEGVIYSSHYSMDGLMKKMIAIHKFLSKKIKCVSPRRDIITNRFYGIGNLLNKFSFDLSTENNALWFRYFHGAYLDGALYEFVWATPGEIQEVEILWRSLKETVDITISELTQLTPTPIVNTYYSYPVLIKEALFFDPTSLDKLFGNFLRMINQIERRSIFFLPTPMKDLKKIINSVFYFSKLRAIELLNEIKEFIERQLSMPCLNTNRFTQVFYSNYATVFKRLLSENCPQYFSSDASDREVDAYFCIIQSNADRLLKELEEKHKAELKAFKHLSLAMPFLARQVNVGHWKQKGIAAFFCEIPTRIDKLKKTFMKFHFSRADTYQKAPSIWKINLIKLFMEIHRITDKRAEKGIESIFDKKTTHFCEVIYQAFDRLYKSLTQQQKMTFNLIHSYIDEPVEDTLLRLSRPDMNFFDEMINEELFLKLRGNLTKELHLKANETNEKDEKSVEALNRLNTALTASYSPLLR